MSATDILGKIGEKVGSEFNSFRSTSDGKYATITNLNSAVSDIATNSGNISTNTGNIQTNANAISQNSTDIATNASAVSQNSTDIATNATSISTNAGGISTNASAITALQTKAGSLATDGNSASFSGNLSAQNLTLSGNLTVSGTQTVINTTTLNVEDNIIEVNLQSDGSETAQQGGLQVNRGSGEDKALVIWDDSLDLFSLKKGTIDAKLNVGDVDAEKVIVPNGSAILINNVSLGNYASFETQFLANL